MNTVPALLESLSDFHFLRPWWFAVLPFLIFMLWRLRRRELTNEWQQFIDPQLLAAMLHRGENEAWLTPRRLAAMMFLLSMLTLAGPTWQRQATPLTDDKAPLVIALLMDESMLVKDLAPTRLQQAILKIDALLQQRRGAPTALIVYAGTAHTVLPLTEDSELLSFYLQELSPDIMPLPGNRADLALLQAGNLLRQQGRFGSIIFVAAHMGDITAWPQQAEGDLPSLQLLLTAATEASDRDTIAAQISDLRMTLVPLTADLGDVEQLLAAVQRHWESQWLTEEDAVWSEAGYYLVWPLLLLMLLFFRKGMVLQW